MPMAKRLLGVAASPVFLLNMKRSYRRTESFSRPDGNLGLQTGFRLTLVCTLKAIHATRHDLGVSNFAVSLKQLLFRQGSDHP